jgi:DNA-binding NtrC family response regulator
LQWESAGAKEPHPVLAPAGQIVPAKKAKASQTQGHSGELSFLERALLNRVLRRSHGNRAKAAMRQGICWMQLYLLIEQYGGSIRIQVPRHCRVKALRKNAA